MPRPYLVMSEIEALASSGAYAGMAILNNTSVAILLSALQFVAQYSNWQGASYDLTQSEKDDIDFWIAQAETELMTASIGLVVAFATSVTPTGMLLCDGAQYAREDYPRLYDVLDSAFIIDADNFVVPDLQDKFIFGEGTNNRGDSGGNNSVSLSTANLPSHNHSDSFPTVGLVLNGELVPQAVYIPPALPTVTGNTGSGTPVNIMNPYLVLGYAIVSGQP